MQRFLMIWANLINGAITYLHTYTVWYKKFPHMAHHGNAPALGDLILLAEDNEDHVFFIKRSFMHARFFNPVHVTRDGVETIAYLNGDGPFGDRAKYPFPMLLLLDLKMPNKDGFEVMEWIRDHADLPPMRIVVLTTSDRIFDIKRAYALGAVGFLTKPLNLHDFIQLGPAIKGFWLWSGSEVPREAPLPQHRQDCRRQTAAFSPALPVADFPQKTLIADVPSPPAPV